MATETRTRVTVEEFEKLDSPRYTQLIDGKIVLNPPKLPHQLAVGRAFNALYTWATAKPGRGQAWLELGVLIDQHNLYAPDVLWTSEAHLPDLYGDDYAVPDLCVEVRSPSTWHYDLGVKKSIYERRALPELWLVDTKSETVLVFRRSRPGSSVFDVALELPRGDTLTSPLLPGFAYELDELFAPLRPRN